MSVFNRMVHCGFIFQKEMKVIHQDIKVLVIKMKNIVPKGAKCNDNTKNSEKKKIHFGLK